MTRRPPRGQGGHLPPRSAWFALVAIIACMGAAPVLAADFPLSVRNSTGGVLSELHISRSSLHTWGPNRLATGPLGPGEERIIDLDGPGHYDLYARDDRGRVYHIWDIAVVEDTLVEVKPTAADQAVGRRGVNPRLAYLYVNNRTGYDLYYLYASPAYADTWADGEHLLAPQEIIPRGASRRVHIDVERWGTMVFDFVAEDEDGDTYVLRRVDLEREYEIILSLDHIRFY